MTFVGDSTVSRVRNGLDPAGRKSCGALSELFMARQSFDPTTVTQLANASTAGLGLGQTAFLHGPDHLPIGVRNLDAVKDV